MASTFSLPGEVVLDLQQGVQLVQVLVGIQGDPPVQQRAIYLMVLHMASVQVKVCRAMHAAVSAPHHVWVVVGEALPLQGQHPHRRAQVQLA
jgi:hypothetical protein